MYDDFQDEFPNSEALHLAELDAGVSGLWRSYENGEIDEGDRDTLLGDIETVRQPLKMAKQVAIQNSINKQRRMAMDENAFGQAMGQQDAQFRANSFNDRVNLYTDPLTGRTAHLVEMEPGKFQEIEFKGAGQESDAAGATIPYHPLSALLAGQIPGATPEKPAAAGQAPAQPRSDAQHTMNINMGADQYQAKFGGGEGNWRQTSQERFNRETGQWEQMPVGAAMGGAPQQKGGGALVTEGEVNELTRRGEIIFRNLPQGPERNKAVANWVSDQAGKIHSQRSTAAEHRQQEAFKTAGEQKNQAAEEAQKAQKAQQEIVAKAQADMITERRRIMTAITKERENWDKRVDEAIGEKKKEEIRAKIPEHLKSDEAMTAYARAKALREAQEDYPEAFQKTEAGKAGAGKATTTPGKSGAKPAQVKSQAEAFQKDLESLMNPPPIKPPSAPNQAPTQTPTPKRPPVTGGGGMGKF